MVARTWESSDMVSGSRESNGEGVNVRLTKVIPSLTLSTDREKHASTYMTSPQTWHFHRRNLNTQQPT